MGKPVKLDGDGWRVWVGGDSQIPLTTTLVDGKTMVMKFRRPFRTVKMTYTEPKPRKRRPHA